MLKSTLVLLTAIVANSTALAAIPDTESHLNQTIEYWTKAGFKVAIADECDAPEASLIYAANAIAVHDAIEIAQPGTPFLAVQAPIPERVRAVDLIPAISSEVLKKLAPRTQQYVEKLLENQPIRGQSDTELRSFAAAVANTIVQRMPAEKDSPSALTVTAPYLGQWRTTFPWASNIVAPQWHLRKPLALPAADAHRPSGPPPLSSVEYALAVMEVRALGLDTNAGRSKEQTEIALFWRDGSRTSTGPGHWIEIALQAMKDLSARQKAKSLLKLNVALYDAGIAAWDAKTAYDFWRPMTAIAFAHADSNSRTKPVARWFPYLSNPMHPEYVSGHSTFSAAAATILAAELGEQHFCASSEGLPNVQRCFDSFWEAAKEAGDSRVYGGIHFSFSNVDGLQLGRDVANNTLNFFSERAR